MDYRDYYMGLYKDYYRDPFPHSLLSTREIRHPKLKFRGRGGGQQAFSGTEGGVQPSERGGRVIRVKGQLAQQGLSKDGGALRAASLRE